MISILGAGAIGQLVAHKLTDADVDCQLIVRSSAQLDNDGWTIEQAASRTVQQITTSLVSDKEPLSLVCICVKSPQLASALKQISHRINAQTQLILFQNGMGHEALAKDYSPEENIFFASNTHGVSRLARQHILYAGRGALHIGALKAASDDKATDWYQFFSQSQLDSHWQTNIQTILYRKLMVNACVNPLTALYQCKNGELLNEQYKPRLLTLISENSRFAELIGLDFESNLKDLVIQVLSQTADNTNSMLQDVNKGVITEIEAINGYLLEQMQEYDFKAPHNWQLWSDFHISYPPLKASIQHKLTKLDATQLRVTQQHGTESPFTGKYNIHTEEGEYHCVCCNTALFDHHAKFDSGCGWPSFDRAQNNKAVAYRSDSSHNMSRIEILCAQCGAHLGHVFNDGPTETGQRFCVNSASLDFARS